jgi:hypothetical protein
MMETMDKGVRKEDVFSKAVRAGKRTYFFDVKSTKADDYYLTITESTKRFNDDGTFRYEKHRVFLYKEDFEKFSSNLKEVMDYIITERGEAPIRGEYTNNKPESNGHSVNETENQTPDAETNVSVESTTDDSTATNDFTNVDFDALGSETPSETETEEDDDTKSE